MSQISVKSMYGKPYKPSKPLAVRIEQRSRRLPNGCLEWTGSLSSSGYPITTVNYRNRRVSHLVWEQANGPVADGKYMCHECDNPKCIELNHLFEGTAQENMQDAVNKGRTSRGEHRPHTKLSTTEVIEIRRLLKTQTSNTVSRLYEISPRHCRAIGSKTMWKHVL